MLDEDISLDVLPKSDLGYCKAWILAEEKESLENRELKGQVKGTVQSGFRKCKPGYAAGAKAAAKAGPKPKAVPAPPPRGRQQWKAAIQASPNMDAVLDLLRTPRRGHQSEAGRRERPFVYHAVVGVVDRVFVDP